MWFWWSICAEGTQMDHQNDGRGRIGRVMERDHWFEELADHMGPAYLRYSFTKGTVKEVDALVARLGLQPPARILDVGCGPGRHANELGRRGYEVHGVDISETFLDVARQDATDEVMFERMDAPRYAVRRGVRRRHIHLSGRIRHERRPGCRRIARP